MIHFLPVSGLHLLRRQGRTEPLAFFPSVLLAHQPQPPVWKLPRLGSVRPPFRVPVPQPFRPFLPIPLPQSLRLPVTDCIHWAASPTLNSPTYTRLSTSTRFNSLLLIPILPKPNLFSFSEVLL